MVEFVVECNRVKYRAMLEFSRVKKSQVEPSRAVVKCRTYSQVEPC